MIAGVQRIGGNDREVVPPVVDKHDITGAPGGEGAPPACGLWLLVDCAERLFEFVPSQRWHVVDARTKPLNQRLMNGGEVACFVDRIDEVGGAQSVFLGEIDGLGFDPVNQRLEYRGLVARIDCRLPPSGGISTLSIIRMPSGWSGSAAREWVGIASSDIDTAAAKTMPRTPAFAA